MCLNKLPIIRIKLFGVLILTTPFLISTTQVTATENPKPLISESEYFEDVPSIDSVTRLPQPKSETPAAVSIIDRDMIRASGARALPDVFRLVAGFQVAYQKLDKPIVTYHGLADKNSRRMLILIDGRSSYGSLSGNVNWQNLNIAIDDIERIEIIRGPNTVTYGDNAFLGTINIITRHSSQTHGMSSSLTSGNHGIGDAQLRYSTHFDGGDMRITTGYLSEYGQDSVIDDFNSRFINLRTDLRPATGDSVLFQLGYGSTKTGIGDIDSNFSPPTEREKKFHSEQISWRHQLAVDNTLQLQIYHNYGEKFVDFLTAPINVGGATGTVQIPINRNSVEERHDFELQHTFNLLTDIRLVWGIGVREDSTQSEAIFTSTDTFKNRSSRVFGSTEWRITADAIVNAGGMWEKNELTDTDFSPRMAVNYHLNHQHTVRAAWSRANRIPSIVEEFADTRITYSGILLDHEVFNQGQLEVETMDSYEFGYLARFPDTDLTLDMRLYRDRIKSIITHTILTTPDERDNQALNFRNEGDVSVDGIDMELTYRPNRATRIVLTSAFMDASAANFTNSVYTAQQYEDTVPDYSGSLLAMHQITHDWNVSLGYYWVDELLWLRQGINNNHTSLQAYERLDFRLARRLRFGKIHGEIVLVVQNAGDNYQDFNNKKPFSTHRFATVQLDF